VNRDDAYRQFKYEQYLAEQAQAEAPMNMPPSQAAPAPTPERELSVGDEIIGTAASAGQGATAGWLDEIMAVPMAGAAHLMGDAPKGESVLDTYSKMKDSIRMRQKQYDTDSPILSNTGRLIGGVAGLGKLGAGGGALKAGLTGGAYGAGEYAGALDDWSDADIQDALIQTGLSAGLGAGMQKGGQFVRDWLAKRPDAISKVLQKLKTSVGANDDMLKARASDMGPEASLADVTGDVGVAFSQGARGRGGMPAIDAVERNLHKVNAAKDRIKTAMGKATGKKRGQFYESMDALKTNRKQNAERLYGAALDEGSVVPTKRMLHIFDNNPMVKDAWGDVQNTYAKNDLPLPKLFDYDDAGKAIWTGKRFPNMRATQELKWAMDKRLRTLRGSVDSAGKKEYSRAMDDYKDFMADVNKQNPTFRKANAQYAGDSAMIDAQEMGVKHGLGGARVEEQMEYIKGLNKSERDSYLQGVMTNTYGKLGASPEHMMGNINQASSENAQQVLNKLMGKDATKKIMQQFKSERRYREVDSKVRQGSQTQLRALSDEAMGKMEGDLPIEELSRITGLRAATKVIEKMLPKMKQTDAAELASILTRPGGVEVAIKRMTQGGMPIGQAEKLVGQLMRQSAVVAPTVGD